MSNKALESANAKPENKIVSYGSYGVVIKPPVRYDSKDNVDTVGKLFFDKQAYDNEIAEMKKVHDILGENLYNNLTVKLLDDGKIPTTIKERENIDVKKFETKLTNKSISTYSNIEASNIVSLKKQKDVYQIVLEDGGKDLHSINKIDFKVFLNALCSFLDLFKNYSDLRFVHRDIKPQNMLFNKKEKKLYLIDFGLQTTTEEVFNVFDKHQKSRLCFNYFVYPIEFLIMCEFFEQEIHNKIDNDKIIESIMNDLNNKYKNGILTFKLYTKVLPNETEFRRIITDLINKLIPRKISGEEELKQCLKKGYQLFDPSKIDVYSLCVSFLIVVHSDKINFGRYEECKDKFIDILEKGRHINYEERLSLDDLISQMKDFNSKISGSNTSVPVSSVPAPVSSVPAPVSVPPISAPASVPVPAPVPASALNSAPASSAPASASTPASAPAITSAPASVPASTSATTQVAHIPAAMSVPARISLQPVSELKEGINSFISPQSSKREIPTEVINRFNELASPKSLPTPKSIQTSTGGKIRSKKQKLNVKGGSFNWFDFHNEDLWTKINDNKYEYKDTSKAFIHICVDNKTSDIDYISIHDHLGTKSPYLGVRTNWKYDTKTQKWTQKQLAYAGGGSNIEQSIYDRANKLNKLNKLRNEYSIKIVNEIIKDIQRNTYSQKHLNSILESLDYFEDVMNKADHIRSYKITDNAEKISENCYDIYEYDNSDNEQIKLQKKLIVLGAFLYLIPQVYRKKLNMISSLLFMADQEAITGIFKYRDFNKNSKNNVDGLMERYHVILLKYLVKQIVSTPKYTRVDTSQFTNYFADDNSRYRNINYISNSHIHKMIQPLLENDEIQLITPDKSGRSRSSGRSGSSGRSISSGRSGRSGRSKSKSRN